MKIYLNHSGPLSPLISHFNLEGDSVSRFPSEADLLLNDPLELVKLSDEPFQDFSETQTEYFITRYHHIELGWLPQVIIGIPLFGLMNENLGPSVCTGCGLRYCENNVSMPDFDSYHDAMKELCKSEFVTLKFGGDKKLLGVQTGIPFYGLFSVLEGVRGKLSDWFARPQRLYESWVVSILVTKNPWPNELVNTQTRNSEVSKICDSDILKHFWSFPKSQQSQGLLGIATAWAGIEDDSIRAQSGTLRRAASFALKTCQSIEVEGKQYRTDVAERVQERWIRLRELGVV